MALNLGELVDTNMEYDNEGIASLKILCVESVKEGICLFCMLPQVTHFGFLFHAECIIHVLITGTCT